MSFNIVDVVKNQLSGDALGHIGGLLGNESSNLDSGLASAIPGLVNGLTQRASLPGGADSLLSAINDQDGGLLDGVGAMLGEGKGNDLIGMGTKVLSGLMGSSGLGALGSIISGVSGLSKNGSSSLLGILAPIVIGQLKKKVMGDGLNASGLMSLLDSQKQNVQSAMPSGMMEQFESAGFISDLKGGAANLAAGAQESIDQAASTVSNASNDASNASAGWIKKLIPVGAIAALGILAFNFFGGSGSEEVEEATAQVEEVAADVTETASIDVDSLGEDLTGMFDNATGALEGITDAASATAALPQLNEISTQVSGLTDMVGNIPEAARGPLSGIVSTGLETLGPVVEKIGSIPGVGDVINPVVEPIIEALQGFAG